MILSSDSITNATRYFSINANDTREKTGNVSFFIKISAFNQNHSVFALMQKHTRRQTWRWRQATYGFNLTIGSLIKEIYDVGSDNLC